MKDFLDIPLHGIYQQNLHVLRENPNVFGVLIELGYLIHPIESDIISDRTFQEKTAKIIAKAIQNFSIEKW
jgi:N-acetylmuramoyl-L-alanine amidase